MQSSHAMRWSYHIITIAGTQVRIHATFVLLLAFIAWQALAAGEGWNGAGEAILLVCAMFTCVLLHEFGHVLAARKYGIKTPDITLLPIGGVARLERMPRKPGQELVVAVCGPLVNLLIAIAIALGLGVSVSWEPLQVIESGKFWPGLMAWNLLMIFFNMIPAFPMDGGRVLRALLHLFTGNYARATRWAATIGQAIAVFAAMAVVTQHLPATVLLIAFFVFFAAGQEAAMVTEQESLRDLRVRDVMLTDFHTLPANAVLREAVDLLLSGSQHDFPVLDEHGGMMGILPRTRLISALAEHGPGYPAQLILLRCESSLTPATALEEAVQALRESECPALAVMDPVQDRLVGLLTAENVGEALMVRAAMQERLASIDQS